MCLLDRTLWRNHVRYWANLRVHLTLLPLLSYFYSFLHPFHWSHLHLRPYLSLHLLTPYLQSLWHASPLHHTKKSCIRWLTLPCLALPCLALPCLALPCLALPCLALPCLALSRPLSPPVFTCHALSFAVLSSPVLCCTVVSCLLSSKAPSTTPSALRYHQTHYTALIAF